MYISHMHLAAISPNACIDYYLRFTKIDAYFYMSDFSRCFNTLTHHMTYSSANTKIIVRVVRHSEIVRHLNILSQFRIIQF